MLYISVRRSTALLLTSRVLLLALQPVQRYSTPCWLFSNTTEPLDLRLEQQQSPSSSKASSGSSPRTQNRRQSAVRKTNVISVKKYETGEKVEAYFTPPAVEVGSSCFPLWMTRPPWKSCRKQGGSLPWGTTSYRNNTQTVTPNALLNNPKHNFIHLWLKISRINPVVNIFEEIFCMLIKKTANTYTTEKHFWKATCTYIFTTPYTFFLISSRTL